MAEKLLIHYRPCDGDQVAWCRISDHGPILESISHGHVSDLQDAARGQRATLLIDASCAAIESINIPSNNRQRQLQAAPFAMEDNLAADIDDLYFAIGKKQGDDHLPVATIDRTLFEHTLETFRQAGIFLEVMAADCLALPVDEEHWSVLIYENNALIKTAPNQGYFCDRDLVAAFVQSLIDEQEQAPQTVTLFYQDDDALADQLLAGIDTQVESKTFQQHPLSVFAEHLNDARTLNLLQGKFSPKRESNALWQPWKAVAAMALVWLVIELIYAGFEIRQLQFQNQQLTVEIEQIFKQANPGTRKFHNLKNRMKSRLKQLRGGAGDDGETFIELLADAAPVLGDKKITIHGMAYSTKHVDMELQAPSLQDLEQLRNQLSSAPSVKVTLSTSVEKDKVKGRLRLEKQS